MGALCILLWMVLTKLIPGWRDTCAFALSWCTMDSAQVFFEFVLLFFLVLYVRECLSQIHAGFSLKIWSEEYAQNGMMTTTHDAHTMKATCTCQRFHLRTMAWRGCALSGNTTSMPTRVLTMSKSSLSSLRLSESMKTFFWFLLRSSKNIGAIRNST